MPRRNKRLELTKTKPVSLVKIKQVNPKGNSGDSSAMFLNPKDRKRKK